MSLLAVLDGGAFIVAPYVATALRFGESISDIEHDLGPLWSRGLAFALVMYASLLSMGLYHTRQRLSLLSVVKRIAVGAGVAFVALAVYFYMFPGFFMGRGLLGLTVAIGAVASAILRLIMSRLVEEDFFKRRVLVYGAGPRAAAISMLRRRTDQRGFVIAGYVPAEGEHVTVPRDRLLLRPQRLIDLCRSLDIGEIVIAMDERRLAFPASELLDCRFSGIGVIDLATFLERETGKLRLDMLNPSWMIFGSGFRRSGLRRFTGRVLDIFVAVTMLTLACPILIATAVAIKLEDGLLAPVFTREKRIGLMQLEFDALVFRTAPRVPSTRSFTRVGAALRAAGLNELPYLFSVLAGDMSFVGPRPECPEFARPLMGAIPFYRERHLVKPGITGWAQVRRVHALSEKEAAESLQYDLYYFKNNSLAFDLSILLQTAEVFLWPKADRAPRVASR